MTVSTRDEQAARRKRLGWQTIDEIRAAPRPPDLIAGVLASSATLLYGLPEAGKSFCSVAMARALLCGDDFLGHATDTTRPHRIVYVCTDPGGSHETTARVGASVRGSGLAFVPLPRADAAWADLLAACREDGTTLLVVDNLSGAITPGADLNLTSAATPVTANLTQLVEAGAAVLLLAHSAKNGSGAGGPLGSVVTSGWGRRQLHLTSGANGVRRLRLSGNDMPGSEVIPFRITDGQLVSVDAPQQAAAEPATERRAHLRLSDAATGARAIIESSATTPAAAGRLLADLDLAGSADAGRKAVERKMLKAGLLVPVPGGGFAAGPNLDTA